MKLSIKNLNYFKIYGDFIYILKSKIVICIKIKGEESYG